MGTSKYAICFIIYYYLGPIDKRTLKVDIIFRYTVLFIPFFLISQEIDTTIVKYFPTDLTRSILLQDGMDKKKVKKGAYFKATYDGSGDLIKIEYIPSKSEKDILDTAQTRTLFYSDWNDYNRELSNPISFWPTIFYTSKISNPIFSNLTCWISK